MNHEATKDETQIIVRPAKKEDIPAIRDIAMEGFGEDIAFKTEHYESQMDIFPAGQMCVEYNNKIVGASGSLIVARKDWDRDHVFDEICDEGYIRNHTPEADHLYGIEVVVHSEYRNLKIGRKLYKARQDLCRDLGLESVIIGGRIPNYHKYEDLLTPEEYAKRVEAREIYDPVMTFQLNNGFTFLRVLKNYLPEDEESRFNATLMEWKNEM
ncbi:GNAT family N-acetyltransferase [Alteribacillus iranensis]|uniref:Acetyltransferase (GNAT) family protein n=1 Tax=Alteribacillus iranensis TaxID=930128 RepID=A0A1I2E138_9BACI|nr:GNAT family N-acetyltransferase [Alteribacillus iranensis]SFE86575.1 Acetyltransferase (GNAT) family protein [Alteribacillus iranensis]